MSNPRGEFDEALSARVVAALENAWAAIRARHPDVPAAVLVLGSGSIGARPGELRLGHFAATRWQRAHHRTAELPEVFVGGEGLARDPGEVLATLLHEAAHAMAHVRSIKDTSRQGRYHNRGYARLAEELGLHAREAGTIGWSDTTLTEATRSAYADVIAQLQVAITLWRRPENGHPSAGGGNGDGDARGNGNTGGDNPSRGGRSRNLIACRCPCGRRIRTASTTLAAGPIACGLCGGTFHPATRRPACRSVLASPARNRAVRWWPCLHRLDPTLPQSRIPRLNRWDARPRYGGAQSSW